MQGGPHPGRWHPESLALTSPANHTSSPTRPTHRFWVHCPWGAIAQFSAVCFIRSPACHLQGPTGTSTQPVPSILQALNVSTTLGPYG